MNKTTGTPSICLDDLRDRPTVSVADAAELLGISRSYAYEMARNGSLPVIELGPRRVRVKSAALLRMLDDSAPTAAPTSVPSGA